MLPRTHIRQGQLGEQYILFQGPDYISDRITHTGAFEADLMPRTLELLGSMAPGRVLDIGANLGSWVIPAAISCPQHDYIAFEPQRTVYYQLTGNVILNSLSNVYTHHLALGSHEHELEMTMPDYGREPNIGGFTLDPEIKLLDGHTTEGQKDLVQVAPLDALEIDGIGLIKMDVEGWELEVLQGAEKTLEANGRPPILFEAWTQYEWYRPKRELLWAKFEQLGYTIEDVCYNNFLARAQ